MYFVGAFFPVDGNVPKHRLRRVARQNTDFHAFKQMHALFFRRKRTLAHRMQCNFKGDTHIQYDA